MMRRLRMTTADALVRWLIAQRTVVDGLDAPLFAGVYAIFGHGNVTCLGQALQRAGDALPTWRGQNEQGMGLAGVAFAKAMGRRQVMVATSSVGPGALNMVTAAGVAMANRLPLLMLGGETFVSRIPDPVLQQVEHDGDPSMTANDAFRAVVRYWDRIVAPEQVVQSLPQMLAVLTDPAACGPAFLGLPQDVQATAWDFPERFFDQTVTVAARPRPDRTSLRRAADLVGASQRPLVIAGGGVHYSQAEQELQRFATEHRLPVCETMAGKTSLVADHPCWVGPIGVTGVASANDLAADADLVVAVGTRLADFTTGSWTVFGREDLQLVSVNTARMDAAKHRGAAVVGDARECLAELGGLLGPWRAPEAWADAAAAGAARYREEVGRRIGPGPGTPSYAQVIGAVRRSAGPDDYVVTAAGGLPGELNANWLADAVGSFDCEYGFSCMGYEIAGGWGAAMARPHGQVFVLVGDGSYLMANSDLYSSVLSGHKMIVVVCDNGGYAVIDRLQRDQGGVGFNNLLADCRVDTAVRVDFAAHAKALGCSSERVEGIAALEAALGRALQAPTTAVVVVETDPDSWTGGGAYWEVGVPEVSDRPEVRAARQRAERANAAQRVGW